MTGSTALPTWFATLFLLLLVAVLVYWGLDLFSAEELATRHKARSLEL